jgi:hypothetical protein
MPFSDLQWQRFVALQGAPDRNFEKLCRSAVRAQYGGYGLFGGGANQPGVEFHLRVTKSSTRLGESGRWWGWQCKWWDLASGKSIGRNRKREVENSIAKAVKFLPGLTDWVLWTRRPLTPKDRDWFERLTAPFQLTVWTEADLDDLLSGEGLILRETYFGDLALDGTDLDRVREECLAPVLPRWHPDLHQETGVERDIRRMLGEPAMWTMLQTQAARLDVDIARLETTAATPPSVELDAKPLITAARSAAGLLAGLATALASGSHALALDENQVDLTQELLQTPRRFRSARHPAALDATNVLADIFETRETIERLRAALSTRVVSVIGDAGDGKTHLAVQATSPRPDCPAGVFLLGAALAARDNLNVFASRVTVRGTPVVSMERLVAAIDAAGERSGRRLALAIDGLNEAEDPRDWKRLVAELNVMLARYPRVLVICTLRSTFVEQALPPDTEQLRLDGFGNDTGEALRRYFAYYKIDATDSELPWEQLAHPLTLYLFCQVTNPKRQERVTVDKGPGSLDALFSTHLEQAAARIADLSTRQYRYYVPDIREALNELGEALWEARARTIGRNELRDRLRDRERSWEQSVVRALEDEGILTQYPSLRNQSANVAPAYDALAGYLIAQALVNRLGSEGLEPWLSETTTVERLTAGSAGAHPLAEDTLAALAALVPRQLYRPLWPMVPEPLQTVALIATAGLDAAGIDARTVDALRRIIRQSEPSATRLLARSFSTRGLETHPLNARFLDSSLMDMTVAQRDLLWTEWARRNEERLIADLHRLQQRWQRNELREGDPLRARWVRWLLTSTHHLLRDNATKALYLFGFCDLTGLFDLSRESLIINDAYVPERLLAATYGVVMGKQLRDPACVEPLRGLVTGLRSTLDDSAGRAHGSHRVIRLYVRGIFLFAKRFYPEITQAAEFRFGGTPSVTPLSKDDSDGREADEVFGMDFENYTVGRLFTDRGNYQTDHAGYQEALAYIRGAVWGLGWRKADLGAIDRQLASFGRDREPRVERYGKKYSWIGLHEFAGVLADRRGASTELERFSDLGIDPSFPIRPPAVSVTLDSWVRETPASDEAWIRKGIVRVSRELLRPTFLDGVRGPWAVVDGYLTQESGGRRVFGIVVGMLASRSTRARLKRRLERPGHPGNELTGLHNPSDYYTFAGEIPWHPDFGAEGGPEMYVLDLGPFGGPSLKVELLAHQYAWESYHSLLNQAGSAYVPSRRFSEAFDLRGKPGTFDQVLPDGSLASRTFSAPPGFSGMLLYVREDLLRRFAGNRAFVGLAWGERQIVMDHSRGGAPEWLVRVAQSGADTWKQVFALERRTDTSKRVNGRTAILTAKRTASSGRRRTS